MITVIPMVAEHPTHALAIGAILLLWIAAVGTRSHR